MRAEGKAFCAENNVGLVSPDIPLLSNLTVYENIALVSRYLTKQKDKEIEETVLHQLDLLHILDSKAKRPSELDTETSFKVSLLRALRLEDSILVIDRPFAMLNNIADIAPIMNMLEPLGEYIGKCIFFDFEFNRPKYSKLPVR